MTIVVALKTEGEVLIGSDSFGSTEYVQFDFDTQKVFKKGDFVIGVCGSYRMCQAIQYHTKFSSIPHDGDIDEHMINNVVEPIREALQRSGVQRVRDSVTDVDGHAIIGYKDQIFVLQSDFSIVRPRDDFYAIGSGRELALGAMSALTGKECQVPPEQAIQKSIEITSKYSPQCGGEIQIERTEH